MGYVKRGGHGGTRTGAGEKAADSKRVVRVITVGLDAESDAMLGDSDNLSITVRSLLAELRAYRNGGSSPVLKSTAKPKRLFVPEVASPSFPDGRTRGITAMLQHEAEVAERNRVAYAKYLTQ